MSIHSMALVLTCLSSLAMAAPTDQAPVAPLGDAERELINVFFNGEQPVRPEWLQALTGSPSILIRQRVAGHSGTPEAGVIAMVKAVPPQDGLWPDPALEVLLAAARRQGVGPALFKVLVAANDRNSMVMNALANNESIEAGLLATLSRTPNVSIRMGLARNPSTPPEVLRQFLDDKFDLVVQDIAQNPACSPDLFDALLRSPVAVVRMTALERIPSLSPRQLEAALAETDPAVLTSLAGRVDLPSGAYERMAALDDEAINSRLAHNPRVPGALLEGMTHLSRYGLEDRVAARRTSRTPEAYLAATGEEIFPLPDDRYLSAADLERLAGSGRRGIAYWVAAHQGLTPELFGRLALHTDPQVRRAVVKNPRCPQELLLNLAQDPDIQVRAAAADTRRLPDALTLEIFAALPEPYEKSNYTRNVRSPGILKALAQDPDPVIRKLAYGNQSCPAVCAELAMAEGDPAIRSLALQKRLSWAQWQRLAKDPDPAIAGQAKAMLEKAKRDFEAVKALR